MDAHNLTDASLLVEGRNVAKVSSGVATGGGTALGALTQALAGGGVAVVNGSRAANGSNEVEVALSIVVGGVGETLIAAWG